MAKYTITVDTDNPRAEARIKMKVMDHARGWSSDGVSWYPTVIQITNDAGKLIYHEEFDPDGSRASLRVKRIERNADGNEVVD